jgi:hypothetical protein
VLKIKDLQANLEPCKSFRMRSSKRVPEVRIIKGLRKRVSFATDSKGVTRADARDELRRTREAPSLVRRQLRKRIVMDGLTKIKETLMKQGDLDGIGV